MKLIFLRVFAGLLTIGLLAGCSRMDKGEGVSSNKPAATAKVKQTELILSVAASLQDSLKEFAGWYAKKHPDIKLTFNFGSSGALQQQIEQGAPVDLFISAGKKQMDDLQNKHLLAEDKQVNLVTNTLVVVVPNNMDSLIVVSDLNKPAIKKIAIGDVEAVPAGAYAKEALQYEKLWDVLQPKYVFAKDVRQVLNYVETGNVDAGFVYRTDALTSTKVKIALTIKVESHQLILYPAGIVKNTKHLNEAAELLNQLQSKEAVETFSKFGFEKPSN
jgi:molybdate transport system substrate-binding protein